MIKNDPLKPPNLVFNGEQASTQIYPEGEMSSILSKPEESHYKKLLSSPYP
jgi:hypothetical protein